jgi:ribonuclease-3
MALPMPVIFNLVCSAPLVYLFPSPENILTDLEQRLGYCFKDSALLALALTHRSADPDRNNERLEFIGDSLLNCEVALLLYQASPDLTEGALSRIRAGLVRQEALVVIAGMLGLSQHLRVILKRQDQAIPDAVLADGVEALFGAVHCDGGYTASAAVIRHFSVSLLNARAVSVRKDDKTRLQEALQALRLSRPRYSFISGGGSDGALIQVSCTIDDVNPPIMTTAFGQTKRLAEMAAARSAHQKFLSRKI